MRHHILRLTVVLAILAAFSMNAKAQFREEAFNQNYNSPSDTTASKDSVNQNWSFKEFYRGVTHKDTTLRIGSLFGGATVFIGTEQMFNRQYWKLPIIYGGLGTTLGMGYHYKNIYNKSKTAYDAAFELDPATTLTVDTHAKDMAKYMFASAGFIYWATLMDGVYNYKKDVPNQAGKATIYSILMPGLGQCYNGEYWKVPIYWGCLIGSVHFYSLNNTNYQRYRRIYKEATGGGEYTGRISSETALYYRDVFRRYRDYSVLAIAGFYLLQVIDANVFAYMQDFEMSDDLSLNISPTIISPDCEYAFAPTGTNFGAPRRTFGAPATTFGQNAFGFKVGITF